MKIINLYGGPGSGKSVTAAWLFAELKLKGYNVGLVTEVAKDFLYQERSFKGFQQIGLFLEQLQREVILFPQDLDFIITDSPIPMIENYCHYYEYSETIKSFVATTIDAYYDMLENLNINCIDVFIKRNHEYDQEGRYQVEEEADKLAKFIYEQMYFDYELNADERIKLIDWVK